MDAHGEGAGLSRSLAGDGPHHPDNGRSNIRYDILTDKDLILATYHECGSFKRAGLLCNCGPDTFRRRFLEFGHVPRNGSQSSKLFWNWLMDRAYQKVSRVPDKCPRDCPGWMAEPDCIAPGQDCIFPTQFDKVSKT